MSEQSTNTRLISLDVFRGMTIAGMVLVNNPGTWSAIYSPLAHAPWHGITPTDYIFPFFLFIVGIAIPIALGKRITKKAETRPLGSVSIIALDTLPNGRVSAFLPQIYLKILQRAAIIFGLGLFMAAFPLVNLTESNIPMLAKLAAMLTLMATVYFWLVNKNREAIGALIFTTVLLLGFYFAGYSLVFNNFATLRIPGVLQRIAVCYALVSILFLRFNWKQLTLIGISLLLLYWVLMTLVPVPDWKIVVGLGDYYLPYFKFAPDLGCQITTINDKACNLAAYLDRLILTEAHIWKSAKVFDPEGILSTLPAIATTISGVLTGVWLKQKDKSETEKAGGMLFFGVVCCAIGWCWNFFFPFNKSLWTSSYTIYTTGLALCFLGFCYWLIDIKGYKNWTKPFVIFGMNALALFVFSGLFARVLSIIKVAGADGKEIALQKWIFDNIFLSIAAPINASLMYAISFILVCLFGCWLLYGKRIYIKV